MKVPGWCIRCKKVKQVNVTSQTVSLSPRGTVFTGTCDQCIEEG